MSSIKARGVEKAKHAQKQVPRKLRSLMPGGRAPDKREGLRDDYSDRITRSSEYDDTPEMRKRVERGARNTRLEALRTAGLWPPERDPFAGDLSLSQRLETIWERYRAALVDKAPDHGDLLRQFVATYNPAYTKWSEEFELDAILRYDSLRRSFFVPFVRKTTALNVCDVFKACTCKVEETLNAGRTFTSMEGMESIYLINVLSRANYNLAHLFEAGVLKMAVNVVKLALVKLGKPFQMDVALDDSNVHNMFVQVCLANCFQIILNFTNYVGTWRSRPLELETSDLRVFRSAFLKVAKPEVLRLGVPSIIKGYLDHLNAVQEKRGEVLTGSQGDMQLMLLNLLGSVLSGFPSAQHKLLDIGIIDLLVSWIGWPAALGNHADKELTAATVPELRDAFRLQLLCLQCLKEAVEEVPKNAQRVSALGGWEKVMDFILWTAECFSINPVLRRSSLMPDNSGDCAGTGRRGTEADSGRGGARAWSRARPSDMHTSTTGTAGGGRSGEGTEATDGDSDSDAAWSAVDNYCAPLSDGSSGELPSVAGSALPCPEAAPRQRTRELNSVFGVLYSMVVSEARRNVRVRNSNATPRGRDGDGGGGIGWRRMTVAGPADVVAADVALDTLHTSIADNDLNKVTRVVLQIVLDLFNEDIRQNANNTRARVKAKTEYPELQLFVLEFLANVVGFKPGNVELCRRYRLWEVLFSSAYFYCGRPRGTELPSVLARKDACRGNLFSKLHGLVLSLLQFVATIEGHDNIEETSKLLELLDTFHDNPRFVATVCDTLVVILRHNSAQTQKSLSRLNALSVISMIVQMQQMTSGVYANPQPEQPQPCSKEEFFKARYAVLSVLSHALVNSDEMVQGAIRDNRTTSCLFNLLFEPEMRKFALNQIVTIMSARLEWKAANLTATDDHTEMLNMYNGFFKMLPRVQQGGLQSHFELLVCLLQAIRDIVRTNPRSQKLFKEVGAFLNLTTLLNVEDRPDRIPTLCVETLRTLTALLADNPRNKKHMAETIGYDQLTNLVIFSLSHDSADQLAENLLPCLFDMLVDGNFQLDATYVIRNPDVIGVLFTLTEHLKAKQRYELLDTFTRIVEKCPLNQSLCCKQHLIYTLLELVPFISRIPIYLGKVISLIEVLGSHSITVKELKKLFSLLKSERGDFRPIAQARLMKALQFMALSRSDGPPMFFDCDGKGSGLVLPPLEKWPHNHGVSFCTWLRVESFDDRAGLPDFQPRLFAFDNDEGLGISLMFTPAKGRSGGANLEVVLALPQGKRTGVCFDEVLLMEKRWYFLVWTHTNNSHIPFRDSEVKLYIDGKCVQKSKLKYPTFTTPLNRARLATNAENLARNVRECSFYGQLGPLYFVEEVLTASQVKQIYQLGSSFDPSGAMPGQDVTPKSRELLAEIAGKVFLHYNCQARSGKFFLDVVPNRPRDRRMDAKVSGNTNSCVTRDVKDIIHCLGGIKVLLPLFAQLNQPLLPAREEDEIDYSIDPNLVLQAFALLGDMLSKSDTNQKEMARCHGFAVVGFLLQQASPKCLRSETLVTLEDLGHKLTNDELIPEFYEHTLFGPRLWIYAHESVQREMIQLLGETAAAQPHIVRDIFPVPKLLDVLYVYYWLEDRGQHGLCGKRPFVHPVTREVLGGRPPSDRIASLRGGLLAVLEQLHADGFGEDETRALLGYLAENSDERQLAELLGFAARLMRRGGGFLEAVVALQANDVFLLLLRHPHETVRVLALQCLSILYERSLTSRKGREAKSRSPAPDYSRAALLLMTFPFGEETYRTLFTILVGKDTKIKGTEHLTIDENCLVRQSSVLPCIFKLSLVGAVVLRQRVLQDVHLLLSNSAENRRVLLKQFGWQDWLFAILANRSDAAAENDAKVVQDIVVNIFKTLIVHSLRHEKNGWRELEQTLAFLIRYDARGVLNREVVTKMLLERVLSQFQKDAGTRGGKDAVKELTTPLVLANLAHLLSFIEEFMYYTPTAQQIAVLQTAASGVVGGRYEPDTRQSYTFSAERCVTMMTMHRDDARRWTDMGLACQMLDTLEVLKMFERSALAQMEQASLKSSTLRPGGAERMVLRFALDAVREGDYRVCVQNVPRIRSVIAKHMANYRTEVAPTLTHVLSSLLRTLKKLLSSEPADEAAAKAVNAKGKALASLIKDLLRACMSELPEGAKQQVTDASLRYLTESGSSKEFISSFNGPQWSTVLAWALKVRSAFEQDEKNFCALIEKQRSKSAALVEDGVVRGDRHDMEVERRLEDDCAAVHKRVVQPEIERRAAAIHQMTARQRWLARQWTHIARSLTNERAPWGSSQEDVHWKLDKTENFSRMRLKLKRNYDFDPHLGAARRLEEQAARSAAAASAAAAGGDGQGTAGGADGDGEVGGQTAQLLISGVKLSAMLSPHDVDGDSGEEGEEGGKGDDEGAEGSWEQEGDAAAAAPPGQEKVLLTTEAELVAPMAVTPGILTLTTLFLYFTEREQEEEDEEGPQLLQGGGGGVKAPKELKVPIDELKEVHLRRYLLRRSALEIFLVDRSNYFLNFPKGMRPKVYNKLLALNPVNLSYYESGSPEQILKRSDLTRRWQTRQLSNFDYLMALNTIAGRTYNDLTQYPVFPWVLQDYAAEHINLNDPAVYRDLSRPVGALNEQRLQMVLARYESFEDPDIPKFHYGSHYSSAAIVLYYMIRVEPFTTYFLQLQGGKFDHADRMFDGIPQTWNNCLTAPADFKELIPEFFYFPDFLVNSNGFDLGVKQNGRHMSDVLLPPWAHGSPEEFVRINRAALESEHVSQHLHEWIDLVFGFKQQGRNAVEAHNVFYYLTYEGAVDIDAIVDEDQRRATESQIDNFGQTPSRLLRRQHPRRSKLEMQHLSLFQRLLLKDKAAPKVYPLPISQEAVECIVIPQRAFRGDMVERATDRVVTIDAQRYALVHRFSTAQASPPLPFAFETDSLLKEQRRQVGVPFATEVHVGAQTFAVGPDGVLAFSCGHWDNAFKCTWLDGSRAGQSIAKHKDLVTCVALGCDGKTLVTGSRDTTLLVWRVQYSKAALPLRVDDTPMHILYGHNDDVTCLAVDVGLDMCLSGSKDGTCILHNLRQGNYVRSIAHPRRCAVDLVAMSELGHVVMYSKDDLFLYMYNINGKPLCEVDAHEKICHMYVSSDSQYLVTGGLDGNIVVRRLYDLKLLFKLPSDGPVRCITMSEDEKFLLAGLQNGRVLVIALPM